MTITRVGTNAKYATGWDAAFSGGKAKKGAASKKKAPAKKAKKGKK